MGYLQGLVVGWARSVYGERGWRLPRRMDWGWDWNGKYASTKPCSDIIVYVYVCMTAAVERLITLIYVGTYLPSLGLMCSIRLDYFRLKGIHRAASKK